MSRFTDLVRHAARELKTVSPDRPATFSCPANEIIRLDSNENPFGPSPRAAEAIQRALSDAHRYPDNNCLGLRNRLSELHDFPVEQILVGAGSTQVITLLCHILLGPRLNAVTSERSFIVYGMAVRATGAQLIEAPMRDNGIDLGAILGRINPQTRIVLLANPNNPTGTVVGAAQVDEFLSKVPSHAVVVLDEAYHDFATHLAAIRKAEYSQSLRYVHPDGHVVVLRTFSKAHGLAGLRIGYGIGPAELLGYCAGIKDTYSVSSAAQAAALAALDDAEHIGNAVTNNADQAKVLSLGLAELGFEVVPTWANFVYCDLGRDAVSISERLLRQDIRVRPLGAWGAPTCIRVSIGKPEQNRKFLERLRAMAL